MNLTSLDVFDSSRSYELHPKVSLRDESFGALAYHHDTRRLIFVKSTVLVDVVRSLERFDSVDDALVALVAEGDRGHYRAALARLVSSDVLRGR